MTFRIGQKVVCVDDSGHPSFAPVEVKKGCIYTISWVGMHTHPAAGKIECLRLVEVARRACAIDPDGNMPFRATRFRPVVERKTETGMAILREILDRESHQDRVPEKVRR